MRSFAMLGALAWLGAIASPAHAQPAATITGTVVDGTTAAAAPAIAHVATQSIETPFTGTYTVTGPLKGTLVVKRTGDELTFMGQLGEQTFTHTALVSAKTHEWTIDLGTTVTVGMVGRLSHEHATDAPHRKLVIKITGRDVLAGSLVLGDTPAGAASLVRKKEALIVYGTHQGGMHVFANEVAAYYRTKGYAITEIKGEWNAVRDALSSAQENGHAYERFVDVSHGGYDGPILDPWTQWSSRADESPDDFDDLVRAFRRGTTPDAKLIFSACHSGGSDRFEVKNATSEPYYNYRYTDELAKRTGRLAAGPMGPTSTEYSRQLVKAIEGEGPTKQETRISTPSGATVVQPGRIPPARAISNRAPGE